MRRFGMAVALGAALVAGAWCACDSARTVGAAPPDAGAPIASGSPPGSVSLPGPAQGGAALNEALARRRSVRQFDTAATLSLDEVAQLLWAAQGITSSQNYRTAPSAGALYPLELYIAAGRVAGLPAGVYRYAPLPHELVPVVAGDRRADLFASALLQDAVQNAAAVVVVTAVTARTAAKYGDRATRYVQLEAGHAAQNILLQAAALELGAVVVGAFDDNAVRVAVGAEKDAQPLELIPVGRP